MNSAGDTPLNLPIKGLYLVPQSMITISEDSLNLRVQLAISRLKERSDVHAKLFGSISVFLSLGLGFLTTSEFKNFLFASNVWQAFYLLCTILSGFLVIYYGIKLIKTKVTDDIVREIIQDAVDQKDLSKDKKPVKILPYDSNLIVPVEKQTRYVIKDGVLVPVSS